MIAEAKKKYPEIKFICADACKVGMSEKYDAVFSNAVLHWIKDQDALLKNVYGHLKTGGRFVAEFGSKGNVEQHRFDIRFIECYDRPTSLKNTENGMVDWLEMFGGAFFNGVDEIEKGKICIKGMFG